MRHALFAIISSALFLWGCKSSQDPIATNNDAIEFSEAQFEIDTAFVSGDTLFATVTYSGGCGTHEFSLKSNGFLLKSLPPKQPLRIEHRSYDDPCRSMIIETLKFDVSYYRGTPQGTTVLILQNWNPNLSYSY